MSKDILASPHRHLPPNLTSYDLLKCLAVVSMLGDHIGYYFYPENLWWRALTMSGPIWFFLVGYGKNRALEPRLWIGMFILIGASFMLGEPILELSVIATIMICRVLIDPVMDQIIRNPKYLFPFTILFIVATLPTLFLFDYGTIALLFAMMGYMVRRPDALRLTAEQKIFFYILTIAGFLLFQFLLFPLYTDAQRITQAVGVIVVTVSLLFFKKFEFPKADQILTKPVAGVLRFVGRHSLVVYVVHLLLFKFLALYLFLQN